MLNKDRCQNRFEQMAELSDMIILFGDNDYYLNDGFIKAAKALNKDLKVSKLTE